MAFGHKPAPVAMVSHDDSSVNNKTPKNASDDEAAILEKWCADLKKELVSFKWDIDPCNGLPWKIGGYSVKGRPLVYAEFGDPSAENVTLILSMVHGDEITPLYLGIELANWLKENAKSLASTKVVIAPLVNPDGFFVMPRTRVNARGVDCNRNFFTRDWHSRALAAWKKRFKSEPRRFPGDKPDSEPETKFQVQLLSRTMPQKILSIHAPLNFTDYDGPTPMSLSKFPGEYVKECMKLRTKLKAISGGFFPGSLGNYAGQEIGIPTVTLELPTADPRKAFAYWNKFKTGIRAMIEFKVPNVAIRMRENPEG